MSFMDNWAVKFAEYKVKKMNDNYSKLEEKISKIKNKPVKITKKNALQVYKYLFQVYFGIVFEIAVTLSLAAVLNVFLPTLIIMTVFAISRVIIKGKHLKSQLKCVVFTTLVLVFTAWGIDLFTNKLNMIEKILSYVSGGILLVFASKTKPFEKLLEIVNEI